MDFEFHTPSPETCAKRHQELFWNLPATARPRRKQPLVWLWRKLLQVKSKLFHAH